MYKIKVIMAYKLKTFKPLNYNYMDNIKLLHAYLKNLMKQKARMPTMRTNMRPPTTMTIQGFIPVVEDTSVTSFSTWIHK